MNIVQLEIQLYVCHLNSQLVTDPDSENLKKYLDIVTIGAQLYNGGQIHFVCRESKYFFDFILLDLLEKHY